MVASNGIAITTFFLFMFVCVVCVLANKISMDDALCKEFCVDGMQEGWNGGVVQGI
jgi:hypothetical protein